MVVHEFPCPDCGKPKFKCAACGKHFHSAGLIRHPLMERDGEPQVSVCDDCWNRGPKQFEDNVKASLCEPDNPKDPIGFRLTWEAIRLGMALRPCECPAHQSGRCRATSMEDCSCHRHVQGDCDGIVRLDICAECKGKVKAGRFTVLICGCVHCEPCAVSTLLSKSWARGMSVSELAGLFEGTKAQRSRLRTLIQQQRGER